MSQRTLRRLAEGLLSRGVKLVSGGTDNHLMLVDLTGLELTGKELEHRLDAVYITANKNTVPNEQRSPLVTSGLRLGTPAVTTRGLTEGDMDHGGRVHRIGDQRLRQQQGKDSRHGHGDLHALSALCIRKSKPEFIH